TGGIVWRAVGRASARQSAKTAALAGLKPGLRTLTRPGRAEGAGRAPARVGGLALSGRRNTRIGRQ
ncbi:MAG: hypothetical protein P8X51_08350, partial [Maritimibacter sp.]